MTRTLTVNVDALDRQMELTKLMELYQRRMSLVGEVERLKEELKQAKKELQEVECQFFGTVPKLWD